MEYILSKIMHRAKTTANPSSPPKKNEDNKGTDEVTNVESTSHVDVNSTEEYKNAGYSCDENESSCQQEKGGTPNKFIERGIKTDENKAFTQRQPSIDDTIDGTIDETGIDLLDESTDNQALVKGFQAHHLSNLHDATLESLINGLNNLRDQNCTVNFSPSDLDYLLTKGNSNLEDDAIRDSVLLRFDPLLSKPVQQVQSLKIVEEESSFNASSFNNGLLNTSSASQNIKEEPKSLNSSFELDCIAPEQGENDKMSLGNMIIENDLKEQFASGENKMSEQNHQEQDFKMTDLQKKMKNDAVKIDDIEKKLKEAEMREDALLKRITEKDKTINKMSGVVEAYEKAIAELIAEKETIVQQCEKKYTTLLANSEVNEKHLDSLEKTFSDLHAKYERTKQMSQDLKENEERLLSEQRKSSELLKKQEQRYEKMKNHALVQLEIANNKLSDLSKAHQEEVRRLKAQLKKEEISKLSTTEQLLQKTKENEELVKICDELLSGNAGNS